MSYKIWNNLADIHSDNFQVYSYSAIDKVYLLFYYIHQYL